MIKDRILLRLCVSTFLLAISKFSIGQEVNKIPLPLYTSGYYIELPQAEIKGRDLKPNYLEISGSAYYNVDYKISTLYLGGPRRISRVRAKLDLITQEVNFITLNNQEIAIPAGNVKEMDIIDSSASGVKTVKLRIGYPPIDNQNELNFYEVIVDGKVTMLKCLLKKIVDTKNEVSGEITKSFESFDNYYLIVNNEMKKLKRDKTFILNLFPDNRQKLEEFAKGANVNFRTYDQLNKLVEYYNSLQ